MPDKLTEDQRRQFEIMFRPGQFWIGLGPRGSGKTSWAMQIASAVIHYYPHVHILSNILLKKKIITNDGRETFKEYYPKNYHKVESIADVFHILPDIMERGDTAILIIDEAMASTGFGGGQTILSADVRAMTSFSTIIRKLRLSIILIAQSEKLIMARYREAEFISGWMKRQYGLKAGYTIQEVIRIMGPRGELIVRTKPTGFATPQPVAQVGDVIFDTAAPAQFGIGKYKKNGKRFNLMAAIAALAVIEEDAVRALRAHLENPPGGEGSAKTVRDVRDVDKEDIYDEPLEKPAVDEESPTGKRLSSEQRARLQELVAAGTSPTQIARELEISKGTASYYARKMRNITPSEESSE